jgi:hypothetical protein
MEALRLARVEGIAGRRLSVRRGLCAAIGATSGRATTRDACVHARIAPVGAHGCTRSPRVDGAIGRMDALRGFGVGPGLCVGLCVVRDHRRDGSRGRRGAASECLDKNQRGGEQEEPCDIHENNRSKARSHAAVEMQMPCLASARCNVRCPVHHPGTVGRRRMTGARRKRQEPGSQAQRSRPPTLERATAELGRPIRELGEVDGPRLEAADSKVRDRRCTRAPATGQPWRRCHPRHGARGAKQPARPPKRGGTRLQGRHHGPA